jgi:hypothetical protein
VRTFCALEEEIIFGVALQRRKAGLLAFGLWRIHPHSPLPPPSASSQSSTLKHRYQVLDPKYQ